VFKAFCENSLIKVPAL